MALTLVWGLTPHLACQKSSAMALSRPGTQIRTDSALRMLALGDSYTIGQSVSDTARYPVQLVKNLCTNKHICFEKPEIIATTGWTTGNLLDALSASDLSQRYQIVTLLIGVNNQYQGRSIAEYQTQFTTLLQRAIALAGNQPSHVLVLSIPDYSVTPFGRSTSDPGHIASQLDAFNDINHRVANNYKVHWLDITGETRKAADDLTLLAADGLHYSEKEYGIWASLMEPIIMQMQD